MEGRSGRMGRMVGGQDGRGNANVNRGAVKSPC